MDLSVVTPMYLSANYLREFYSRVCAAAEKITSHYEIIFVNDGSPDDSLEVALSLFHKDPRVRVIDLSRNFGHHKAMMTGLAYARGDLVFLVDCDLEEDPELLLQFHEKMSGSDSHIDVVYGIQTKRKGGFFERLSGKLFYRVLNLLCTCEIPTNLITARLMTKRYVSSLVEHRDQEVFLAGLWAITGYVQVPLPVHKHCRSRSSYNLKRKLSILVNSVTSFSNRPLVFIFYLGMAMMFVSTVYACYLVVRRLFFGVMLAGWPTLVVSVWFLGGLTIFCLGIIGIYLSKIFTESKRRPYTIVRQIYDRGSEG